MKFEAFESEDKKSQLQSTLFSAVYEDTQALNTVLRKGAFLSKSDHLPGVTLSEDADFRTTQRLDQSVDKALDKLSQLIIDPGKIGNDADGGVVADGLVNNILNGAQGWETSLFDSKFNAGKDAAFAPPSDRGAGLPLDVRSVLPDDIGQSPDVPGADTADRLRNPKGINLQQKRGYDPRTANGSPGWNQPDQAPPPAPSFGEGSILGFLADKAKETADAGKVMNPTTRHQDANPVPAPATYQGTEEPTIIPVPVSDIVPAAIELVDDLLSDESDEWPAERIQVDAPKPAEGDVVYAMPNPEDERQYLDTAALQAAMVQSLNLQRQSLTNPNDVSTRNRARAESLGTTRNMNRVSNPNIADEDDESSTDGEWRGSLSGIGGGDPFQERK